MTTYYSQWKQDQILNENFFKNKKQGFFIDIGAHDGITINNTYYFEKNLDWKGIAIEPIPQIFETLKKNRKCNCILGGAYNKNGKIKFTKIDGYSEMLSGISDSYDNRHKERINNEIKTMGGNIKEIEIDCFTLERLIDENKDIPINTVGKKIIDYLSIDTEGSELQILEGINFDKAVFDVIEIEENYYDEKIYKLLERNGYFPVMKIGGDVIFRLKKLIEEKNITEIGNGTYRISLTKNQ